MQARYYFHPVRHSVVSEYFASVQDRARANNMLLHLSDALVRSSMLDTRKLSAVGLSDDAEFEVHRIRISADKYPALHRLYTASPSRLRGYIFGEVLAEAARFRKDRPDEAGMLFMNLTANLEDVGEDAYPVIGSTGDTKDGSSTTESTDQVEETEEESVNGLNTSLIGNFF